MCTMIRGAGREVRIKTSAFGSEHVETLKADVVASVRVAGLNKGTVEGKDEPYLTVQYRSGFMPKTATAFGAEQVAKLEALQLKPGDFINLQILPTATVFRNENGVSYPPRRARIVEVERAQPPQSVVV